MQGGLISASAKARLVQENFDDFSYFVMGRGQKAVARPIPESSPAVVALIRKLSLIVSLNSPLRAASGLRPERPVSNVNRRVKL